MFKLVWCVFIGCCIALVGCKSEGAKSRVSSSSASSVAPITHFTVSGQVYLDGLQGAKVEVFPLVAAKRVDDPVATGVTLANGQYSLNIPIAYLNRSAVIRAHLQGAKQVCNRVLGCGANLAFGASQTLNAPDAILEWVVPQLQNNGRYHGSLIASLASALAMTNLLNIEESASAQNGVVDLQLKAAIISAHSKVANAFGLVGELMRFDLVDFGAPSESIHPDAMTFTLLNNALLDVALNKFPNQPLSAVIQALTQQYLDQGILAKDTSLDKNKINHFDLAKQVTDSLLALQTLTGQDYSQALTTWYTQQALYRVDASTEGVKGVASETANAPLVQKAKRLAASVREVGLSLDLRSLANISSLSGLIQGDTGKLLEGFGVKVNTSQVLKGEKSDRALAVLQAIIKESLNQLLHYYFSNQFPLSDSSVKMTHIFTYDEVAEKDKHQFRVSAPVDTCQSPAAPCPMPVGLVIFIEASNISGNTANQEVYIDDLAVNIVGVLGDEQYQYIFSGPESKLKANRLTLGIETNENEQRYSFVFKGWDMQWPLSILSKASGELTTLDGLLESKGNALAGEYSASESKVEWSDNTVETSALSRVEILRMDNLHLSFGVSIKPAGEDDFYAGLNILQGGELFKGNAVYSSYTHSICNTITTECWDKVDESSLDGETEDNFLKLYASVAYKASLKAVPAPVTLAVSGVRESPSVNTISQLKVSYPGNSVSLAGKFGRNGGITDLDGISADSLKFDMKTKNDGPNGNIWAPSGESAANIINMGQWIKIVYANGEWESLF